MRLEPLTERFPGDLAQANIKPKTSAAFGYFPTLMFFAAWLNRTSCEPGILRLA